MIPDVRYTVYNPAGSTILALNAANDTVGGMIQYEDTPTGCGAGKLVLGMSWENCTAAGYYTAYNLVEISTGDVKMTASSLAGATKIYVSSNACFDTSKGEDAQQAYFYDGATLTMRVPVTGVGSDGGGPYITIGAPLSGGGNPTTIPAYTSGTIVGRRRYMGRIVRRSLYNTRAPRVEISLVGLQGALKEVVGTWTFTAQDVGAAAGLLISNNISRWPFFAYSAGNFPTVGSNFTGSRSNDSVANMMTDVINAVSNGDVWALRVGHDLKPRLVKLYTSSSNTYTYNVILPQGVTNFEPVQVRQDGQDASTLYNAVMVLGDTDPTTKQPVAATVTDSGSITNLGIQIDAVPVQKAGLKDANACAGWAQALLNQSSLAQSSDSLRVYTRNDQTALDNLPAGVTQGDVVRGFEAVTVTRFDATGSVQNYWPDSNFVAQPWFLQLSSGFSIVQDTPSVGTNCVQYVGTGAASGTTVRADLLPGFNVVQGQTYTVSVVIDATQVTAGNPELAIASSFQGAPFVSNTKAAGTTSRLALTFTATYTGLAFPQFLTNNCTVSSGGNLRYYSPQIDLDRVASPTYVVNNGSPNIFGLVTSAVTTYDCTNLDSWQDVTFAAIEPDWTAALAEKANAIQTGLRSTLATQSAVDAFCVSNAAYPRDASGHLNLSVSGLVVTVPSFLALFGAASTPINAGGNTFTCVASTTNWVWLTAAGGWDVQTSPTPRSGEILYGIFTTNATTVVGQFPKAPIGAPALQTIVDIAGNGQQVDLKYAYEVPPNASAFQGYVAVNSQGLAAVPMSWEKSGVFHDLTKGPLVFQMTGRTNNVGAEFGIGLLCDSNSGGDIVNGYLLRVNGAQNLEIHKATSGSFTLEAHITSGINEPSTPIDHTLTVLAYIVTSGQVAFAVQWDSSPWLTWVDTTSPRWTGYFGVRQGIGGGITYLRDFTVSQGQAAMDAIVGKAQKKNLVLNGNNSANPASFGWTKSWAGGSMSANGTYTLNGQSLVSMRQNGLSGAGPGSYQLIPVTSGKTYTCVGLMFSSTGGQARIYIGGPAITDVQMNATVGYPLGTFGSFYQGAVNFHLGTITQTTTNTWEAFAFTFTVPNGYNQASVLLQNTLTNPTDFVYWMGVQVYEGNVLQDYIDHEPNQSYLTSSTPLNGQGSLLNVAGTPVYTYSSTTTSITISIPTTTYTYTDNSTTVTVGAYSHTYSGLTANTTYSFDIWYDIASNSFGSAQYPGAGPSKAQLLADCYRDGRLSIYAFYQLATPSSGTGGGSAGGGSGGGGVSCPADYQLVRTLERGWIRADEVDLGMHLPGPEGWVKVIEAAKLPTTIWRYTLQRGVVSAIESVGPGHFIAFGVEGHVFYMGHDDATEESFDVNDTHALLTVNEEWVEVPHLAIGTKVALRDDTSHTVHNFLTM